MSAVPAHPGSPGIDPVYFDDLGQASAFGVPHDMTVYFRNREGGHTMPAPLTLRYGRYDSATLGSFMMAVADDVICRIMLRDDETACRAGLHARWPGARLIADAGAGHDYAARIDAYWAGKTDRLGNMSVHLEGTAFQLSVWHALMQVPMGACVSYAAIARAVGAPGAARAVGSAVAANPVPLLVPCHRVVKSGGAPGGYAWGRERKKQLLDLEAHVNAGPMQAV